MSLPVSLTASGALSVDLAGHSVIIPFSLSGLATLRWILEAQAEWEKARRDSGMGPTIGFPAAPTQSMVDAFLATHRVDPAPAGRTAAEIAAYEARQVEREERTRKRAEQFAHLDLDISL